MEKIEIKNFSLKYNGMYYIIWNKIKLRVKIELNTILKMLEKEGLSFTDIDKAIKASEPIPFNKIVITAKAVKQSGRLEFLGIITYCDAEYEEVGFIDVEFEE
jgi:hypothetical protein